MGVHQGAKKIIFTACHLGIYYSPNIISTSPQKVFDKQNWFHSSSVIWIPQKNFTCPLGKLKPEFTSPIGKSISPGLLDATFFVSWCIL